MDVAQINELSKIKAKIFILLAFQNSPVDRLRQTSLCNVYKTALIKYLTVWIAGEWSLQTVHSNRFWSRPTKRKVLVTFRKVKVPTNNAKGILENVSRGMRMAG